MKIGTKLSNFGGQKGVGRGQKILFWKFFLNYINQKATEKTIAIIIFSNFKMMIRPIIMYERKNIFSVEKVLTRKMKIIPPYYPGRIIILKENIIMAIVFSVAF